jgi:hypothetical protein
LDSSLGPNPSLIGRALLWSLSPAICWLWLLFFVPPSRVAAEWRRRASLFALWILPPVLLLAVIRSVEPGDLLPVIVPLCLAGGWTIARASEVGRQRQWRTAGALLLPALFSVALFHWPPLSSLHPVSAVAIRNQEERVGPPLMLLESLSQRQAVTVIASPLSRVPWNVLAYYHPEIPVIVLHSDPGIRTDTPGYWLIRNGRTTAEGRARITVPGCGSFVWFLSERALAMLVGQNRIDADRLGPALVTNANQDESLRVGLYNFTTPSRCE